MEHWGAMFSSAPRAKSLLCPGALKATAIQMASADGVSTGQSDNLFIIEALGVKDPWTVKSGKDVKDLSRRVQRVVVHHGHIPPSEKVLVNL